MAQGSNASAGLPGKRALVTGGTRGIGLAIVQRLAEEGVTVVTSARKEAPGLPDSVTLVTADVSTPEGVRQLAESAFELLGGIDILVNNAGGASSGGMPQLDGYASISDEEWVDALNTNYLAAVRLDRAVLPSMVEQGSGVIIEVASTVARRPAGPLLHYGAAKAALVNYAKGLATQVAPHGIRVNSILPGLVKTPAMDLVAEHIMGATGQDGDAVVHMMVQAEGSPMAGITEPSDVADLVAFLASDRARRITGVGYVIDGGALPQL
ncbi:oxidoreductase [Streptomyces musisoli]|uniref:oxidoreductase n=1 Tax=Streptomyces musisoli TaxID=2802280 RepID=UPI001F1A7C15|nr:oxidoreductase [Streptomyces musisoli]